MNLAQTNLQLYHQLHAAGYAAQDLRFIQRCYRLAAELFTARYRGNGRPFVCHLVGSASTGAQIGMKAVEVGACLLHAAYEQGVFPSGRTGPRPNHRDYVRERVGAQVESLVHAYQVQPWHEAAIDGFLQQLPVDAGARTAVEMRLADQLDDLVDLGGATAAGKFDADARRRVGKCAILAERLGHDDLAISLRELVAANAGAGWVQALDAGPTGSFHVMPSLRSVIRHRLRSMRARA